MAHFESMPQHSRMRELLMRFPQKGAVLMGMAEQFLRGSSELSHPQKELLFAYGSALNDCDFCHISHKMRSSMRHVSVASTT
jgi:AhpD family alkylhydroperoxidase